MSTPLAMLPEWAQLDAVILAWPHANTDWAPWLEQARATYRTIISAINKQGVSVILLTDKTDIDSLKRTLNAQAKVALVEATFNDTWVRDYGFITCADEKGIGHPVEFQFNGWGQKFNASDDNQVNQKTLATLCDKPISSSNIVAEGGALEIDQHRHLLTTAQCLLNPARNGDLSLAQYEAEFRSVLGCEKVTVLHHGHLEGDDTDGHIDTLVRFTPDGGLVIQAAYNREEDSHYEGLNALCMECAEKLPEHKQFHLPLPYILNEDGDRLPASYANYLICNGAILLPVYNQPEDAEAIEVVKSAYPEFDVVPIDCSVLVRQYGSLHCISMQVPVNTLNQPTLNLLKQGVSQL